MVPSYKWIGCVKSRILYRLELAEDNASGLWSARMVGVWRSPIFRIFCGDGLQWRALGYEIDFLGEEHSLT
jgi:hypothetical protein